MAKKTKCPEGEIPSWQTNVKNTMAIQPDPTKVTKTNMGKAVQETVNQGKCYTKPTVKGGGKAKEYSEYKKVAEKSSGAKYKDFYD